MENGNIPQRHLDDGVENSADQTWRPVVTPPSEQQTGRRVAYQSMGFVVHTDLAQS